MKCSMCLRAQVVLGVKLITRNDLGHNNPYREAITVMNGEAVCGEHAAEAIGHTGRVVKIETP